MDYRKYYEERTNKKIPKTFIIHHIDFDKNNNEIENLVALPNDKHLKYHKLFPFLFPFPDLVIKGNSETGGGYFGMFIENLQELYKIYKECQSWVDYRNFLLGLIDDIHSIGDNYGIKK